MVAAPISLGCVILAASWHVMRLPGWAGAFGSFWAASFLALQGRPEDVYNPAIHNAVEQTILNLPEWLAFFYPPPYLLICLPFALLPFFVSALAFMIVSAALFMISFLPAVPHNSGATAAVLASAFIWDNLVPGQNGLLIAALFIFGVRWLDKRPILAGICLGCLIMKPQFAIVLPFAFIASRRWIVLATASITAGALILASTVMFGMGIWLAFVQNLSVMQGWARTERPGLMLSVLGESRLVGESSLAAYALQGIVTVACCAIVTAAGRRHLNANPFGAVICVAAALASPWMHIYDLAILMFPLMWVLGDLARSNLRAWEAAPLFAACVLPLFWSLIPGIQFVPATPIVLAGLLGVIWTRLPRGQSPGCPMTSATHHS
jgi:alpha-1,2-mannosyltransferase